MDYQTLAEKIGDVLDSTLLKKEERSILMQSYLHPGIAENELSKSLILPKNNLIDSLVSEGMILRKKEGKKQLLYPMPIALLFKKFADQRKARKLDPKVSLGSIDQWIKYPLLRTPEIKMKSSQDNQTVIQWLFELHSTDWERVFCFGDYESFIETIGIDIEQDWIRERMGKNRCASVIATQDGKWAQHIQKASKQELRDCVIDPKDFTDMFIMAFPDINTTVIGSSEDEVTFVHSSTVAKTYAELVHQCLTKKTA